MILLLIFEVTFTVDVDKIKDNIALHLKNLGYLNVSSDINQIVLNERHIADALKTFQFIYNITADGKANEEFLDLLKTR